MSFICFFMETMIIDGIPPSSATTVTYLPARTLTDGLIQALIQNRNKEKILVKWQYDLCPPPSELSCVGLQQYALFITSAQEMQADLSASQLDKSNVRHLQSFSWGDPWVSLLRWTILNWRI